MSNILHATKWLKEKPYRIRRKRWAPESHLILSVNAGILCRRQGDEELKPYRLSIDDLEANDWEIFHHGEPAK